MTTIKDSGAREDYEGGMVRDTEENKLDWTNIFYGPMVRRWAAHTTAGRAKYADPVPGIPNWSLGLDLAVWLRARRSFLRHQAAWLAGQKDEDHAAGMFFNINLKEYIEERLPPAALEAARNIEDLHARSLGFEPRLPGHRMSLLEASAKAALETHTSVPEVTGPPGAFKDESPWGECGKTCPGRKCFDTGCQGDNPNYQPEEEAAPDTDGDIAPGGKLITRGQEMMQELHDRDKRR